MWDIAIVGAGGIGSRHAQGLARLDTACRVHIVDPSSESRSMTRDRWADIAGGTEALIESESVEELAGMSLDLAIVATTARHRLNATETLLGSCHVDSLLLEKVLFQRDGAYDTMRDLLCENDTTAWVNCPRRLYDIYQAIASEIEDGPVDLDVTGTGWGLGCNGIHFVDLFTWFTGASEITWNRSGLNGEIAESDREGFVEFHGRLAGHDQVGNTISLRNFNRGGRTLSVRISTPADTWHVHEFVEHRVHEHLGRDGPRVDTEPVSIPYQSELTGTVAEDILTRNECPLPMYDLAASEHRPFLRALRAHIEDVRGEEVDRCPIT
jgi:predicted dehydrogenase